MCTSKLHLSTNDKRLLRSFRIEPFECPACKPKEEPKPKLRVEEPRPTDDQGGD